MENRYADPEHPRALDRPRRESGRSGNAQWDAAFDGATNLLDKAAAALDGANEQRATALIARVCAMTEDPEEGHPGVVASSQLLYDAVTDDLEASPTGDAFWLDVSLATWEALQGAGRIALASTLRAIADVYEVSPHEARRIRQVPDVGLDPDFGLTASSTAADRVVVVRSLLEARNTYDSLFMEMGRDH